MPERRQFNIRMDEAVRAALAKAAADDDRPISVLAHVILRKWLVDNGYMKLGKAKK